MTGHLKDNVFVLTALQGGLLPFLISDVLHVIAFYRMVLHGIVLSLTVLHCWLRRAGCISQDTYLLNGYDDKGVLS